MGTGPAQDAGLSPLNTETSKLRPDKPQKKSAARRCIVRGESGDRHDLNRPLLRFVAAPDNTLVFDAAEKLPGRGCYVTADPVLLQQAIDRKAFARALKGKVTTPPALIDSIRTQLTDRVLAGLGLAKKGGALALGEDAVAQAIQHGQALAILTAADASDRTAGDLAGRARHHDIDYIALPLDAATLGFALGRDNTVYLALLQSQPALMRDCARLAPFVTMINQNTAQKVGQKVET